MIAIGNNMDDMKKIMNTGVFADMGLNDMVGTKEEAVQEIRRLEAVNKKLVDALEFYANPNNYELYYDDDDADMNGAMNGKAKAVLQELNTE